VLKLTYEHLQFITFFLGVIPPDPVKGHRKVFGKERGRGIGGKGMKMR
jgi:hypothetical protein